MVTGGGNFVDTKSFNTEREILYRILFDMRKDITDLKALVNNIMSGNVDVITYKDNVHQTPIVAHSPDVEDVIEFTPDISRRIKTPKISDIPQIEDTEEYVEESLAIPDAEKDIIIKALTRHRGKRKYAAQDLKISERTLYRKIKEYDLENMSFK